MHNITIGRRKKEVNFIILKLTKYSTQLTFTECSRGIEQLKTKSNGNS